MKRFRPPDDDNALDNDDGRPSKSARKRAAQDAQKLGAQLVELSESRLRELPLEESLLEAILSAKAIKAHGGLARQLQYIGKLMREIDTAPIVDALAEPARARSLETERDKRITAWRDRLLAEGDPALAALRTWRPDEDLMLLAQTLARARDPRLPEAQRLGAKRELYRALRTLFTG
jgi:ribosome-associated protein